MESALSNAAFALATAAAFFSIVIASLTLSSGKPVEQLGKRPSGSNLWGWLFAYYAENVGIAGYDSSLGTIAPPLRVLAHLGCISTMWAVVALFMPVFGGDGSQGFIGAAFSTSSGIAFCLASTVYGGMMIYFHHILPGVSMPSGPRPHKIQRQPEWKDSVSTVNPTLLAKWRCAVAQDSHDATHSKFGFASALAGLTGEPSGRQIWTTEARSATSAVDASDDIVEVQKKDIPETPSFMGRLFNFGASDKDGASAADSDDKADQTKSMMSKQDAMIQTMAQGGREYFGFNPSVNPNSCDMVFRAQQIRNYVESGKSAPSMTDQPKTPHDAARKAAHFYSMLQTEDGHWAGDYGGPHFLMPGLVTAWYVMGKPENFLDKDQTALLQHYIIVHQQSDGGWGTHLESPSTMFGSTLMYVALRLLGTSADHPASIAGRNFLLENGGALMTSSWSKFYLCLLGCMEWEGHNSVPPEMWMLPNWVPFHPGRMWCHARMVYLPMGYLYGSRFVYDKAGSDPLIAELRKELYKEPYDSIEWTKTRHWVAPMDNYSPIPWVMKTLQDILARYESWSVFQPFKNAVRKLGLDFSLEYMQAEDLQTNYIDIGPVNKVLNMISFYHAAGGNLEDPRVAKHMMRIQDYLWIAEDGMKMQGYNGSQCWDTSFCMQAMYEADLLNEFPDVATKAWAYFERTQILSTEVSQASPAYEYEAGTYRNKFYRHISEGGWPFSTSAHGWPISDCTAEGLKASLCLMKCDAVQKGIEDKALNDITQERLEKAANILLSYQNEDGGWATYENNRGWGWYEQLNPSEAFGDIMIDYSYVECSMASVTALADFREKYPDHRSREIEHSIAKGRNFLKSVQRSDGSWYGSWACCFTYGIWFGVEGLIRCGEPLDSPSIKKACEYLLKQQRPNGGWGEDFTSCFDKDYAKDGMKMYGDDGSGVVNTAWALLSLSMAKCPDVDAVKRGVQYLMKRQLPSGDWPQEGISGVFNRSTGITYTSYRNVFPIWAIGRCIEKYGNEALTVNSSEE
eukprot:CAMPEP_0119550102 /NCGR_PEP_ID=MMETSP1352-20130426/3698_1 /TAXON_ID=265584 /ORGANISM="Stauroneis constricta, Strain CCMP1120" /LENGTH=1022 /DNA_ID=CAMNT_0007595859 /DNA_START=59 /DNA_END=3127 /DNA_ORIENTATION=+